MVDNPKVFEFAKELGLETMGLMTKLRQWNIPVKSHMAELDSDTISLIRNKLKDEKSPKGEAAPAAKKPAAKKAAAPKKAVAPVAAKDKKDKEKDKGKDKAKGKDADVEATAAAGAKRVIRRKAGELTPAQLAAEAAAEAEAAEAEAQAQAQAQAEAEERAYQEEEDAREAAAAQAAAERAAARAAAEPPSSSTEASAQAPTSTPPEAPASAPVQASPHPRPGVREVVVEPRPSNIVGRMDLSRAQRPQSSPGGYRPGGGGASSAYRPGGGGASSAYRPGGGGASSSFRPGGAPGAGPRSSGMGGPRVTSGGGGRPLRTGFVAPVDIMADFEETQKREEKKRKAKGGPVEGVVAKEAEVEQFTATEFRKREIVFQPKKKRVMLDRAAMKTEITKAKASKRVVKMHDKIKVSDFAQQMGLKAAQVTTNLMKNGLMVTMNDLLDFDTASLVAPDFGFEVVNEARTAKDLAKEFEFGELEAEPILRAPVVTVMGHVDHGKTSLLDAIRAADVASKEAGGITQHIGAYRVTLEDGSVITFIDTPGHEAFTAMRARGANVTDLVVLVVAADDGVMKQTIEAINHAKTAKVPIIVAVNKMDKPGANPDRIKQQLTEYELVAEEWGGQTPFMPVSAMKKTGIKELLEQIHLQAEVLELKSNPKRSGWGYVVESKLEKGRGVVATLLVKDGTVSKAQYIAAGGAHGRVRALINDKGQQVESAGPGEPVEILGLDKTPNAGDIFNIVKDDRDAENLAKQRSEERAVKTEVPKAKMSLEDLFSKVQAGDVKELPLILKSDVAGSSEALKALLEKASTDKVKIRIIHTAIGGINESDVLLASSAKAIVVGFNTRPDSAAENMAKQHGVEIKLYSIIYDVVDDIKKAMEGLLAPTIVEKVMGRAEVRNTFNIPKIGMIAGCSVQDGKIVRSNFVRLVRNGIVIYDGKISSLRRFKDDVREVDKGYECGIGIENYNDLKVGDIIEAYEKTSVAGQL